MGLNCINLRIVGASCYFLIRMNEAWQSVIGEMTNILRNSLDFIFQNYPSIISKTPVSSRTGKRNSRGERERERHSESEIGNR